jgi:hypothetical protein
VKPDPDCPKCRGTGYLDPPRYKEPCGCQERITR